MTTRIMVFGTFDMIHEGHEAFFREARSLAPDPVLIVSLARDASVLRIKGRPARFPADVRMRRAQEHPLVDEAVLGDEIGYMPHILRAAPQVIALGYDQEGEYVTSLEKDLAAAGLETRIVRLGAHQPHRFKTSKLLAS